MLILVQKGYKITPAMTPKQCVWYNIIYANSEASLVKQVNCTMFNIIHSLCQTRDIFSKTHICHY